MTTKAEPKNIYPCSILISDNINNTVDFNHTPIMIKATNYNEALGIGMQVAERLYPNNNKIGRIRHVQVNKIPDIIVTAENIESVSLE